jgi:hypothetical protein
VPSKERSGLSKTLVITQSNYVPWRGYFDMLRSADEVILLESVQYTRSDWRNRNRIKTPQGVAWLTIPVEVKGRYGQTIAQTRVADAAWAARHIRSLELAYRRAAGFEVVAPWLFERLREVAAEPYLSAVNERLLRALCDRLRIATPLLRCIDVIEPEVLARAEPTERLVRLALARGATRYLSGPAAQDYLDLEAFARAGIEVSWMDYRGYPEYPQLWGPFEAAVSIVDLLLNMGEEAPRLLDKRGSGGRALRSQPA